MEIEVSIESGAFIWHPVLLLPGLGMLVVAVGAVFFWRSKHSSLAFLYYVAGALTWMLGVVVKVLVALALNAPVSAALNQVFPSTLAAVLMWLWIGGLTGVFEVVPTWLVLRSSRFKALSYGGYIAFGIGFAAIEAALLALVSLGTVFLALVVPELLPDVLLTDFREFQGVDVETILAIPASTVERTFSVFIHVASCILVATTVATGKTKWFWIAFVYKSFVDTIAAISHGIGVDILWNLWVIEIVFGLFALLGYLYTRRAIHVINNSTSETFVGESIPSNDC